MYFGAPPFGVLFFAIQCLQKGKIDPNILDCEQSLRMVKRDYSQSTNLLPRTPFRPRKKKSKEANLSTSASEAGDDVPTGTRY